MTRVGDSVLVAEFDEGTGPVCCRRLSHLSSELAHTLDVERFVLRCMAVDFRRRPRGQPCISRCSHFHTAVIDKCVSAEDLRPEILQHIAQQGSTPRKRKDAVKNEIAATQDPASEAAMSRRAAQLAQQPRRLSALVYHFNVPDFYARGYTRACAVCYVSPMGARKLRRFLPSMQEAMAAVARRLIDECQLQLLRDVRTRRLALKDELATLFENEAATSMSPSLGVHVTQQQVQLCLRALSRVRSNFALASPEATLRAERGDDEAVEDDFDFLQYTSICVCMYVCP
ncbi:MAG: hypothetical protein MHM6MM_008633, partial [Cercozoa sp. M6MM]